MGSPRHSDGSFFLWMGSAGTARDISPEQAETYLVAKDYVASPLPEVEKLLKLLNMTEWQAGLERISDQTGNPTVDPIAYALIFNDVSVVNDWVATGEFNDDEIFHVHVMFKTSARTDSCRLSIKLALDRLHTTDNWMNGFGQKWTCDLLKLQKCHKPEGLLEYMMKGPLWVCSNHDRYLQLCYDIDTWNLNERFKQKKQKSQPELNEITRVLLDIIVQHNCKTLTDIMKAAPEEIVQYLHRPGLVQIVNNCLSYVVATKGAWQLSIYEKHDPDPEVIHRVLLHQGIQPSMFDKIFHTWITKQDPKRNTIMILGPSNTGKSCFIKGLKYAVPWGEIVNTNSGFGFEGILDSVIGCWEEPLLSSDQAEKAKQVLEGMSCSIPVKYKKPQLLERTPIIITSNHHLWRYCSSEETALMNRMWLFEFNHNMRDSVYVCRTSEYSCQCRHCTASRSCSSPHGESSAGRVQRAKQPLPTGEQSIWSDPSTNVGTGPMRATGTGPSFSHSGSSSFRPISPKELSSDTAGHTICTPTPIVQHLEHRVRSIDSTDRVPSTITSIDVRMESDKSTGSFRHVSHRDGRHLLRQLDLERGSGSHGSSTGEHDVLSPMGSMGHTTQKKKKIPIPAKKRKLDREVGSRITLIPLSVPTKQDWEEYLSWLYHYYG
ncbi:NS1 [turkey parvovirus 2]|uniref:NS1 n=1 Tax=turkey parvovirus 2 TaxID=2848321 RepID=W0GAL7_9VIRU|nr:NS1 [turkey parvovirus 2]AHF54687.1 NS1 [turkey parvovirus 2]